MKSMYLLLTHGQIGTEHTAHSQVSKQNTRKCTHTHVEEQASLERGIYIYTHVNKERERCRMRDNETHEHHKHTETCTHTLVRTYLSSIKGLH